MNKIIGSIALLRGLIGQPAQAEEMRLVCTGQKLISSDGQVVWSNEISIDLQTAKVTRFDT